MSDLGGTIMSCRHFGEASVLLCDMFSRKKNAELLLYDQNKNKYRFYWNENYGELDEKTVDGEKIENTIF